MTHSSLSATPELSARPAASGGFDCLPAAPGDVENARNVRTTWIYTLASIVFFIVVLDGILATVVAQAFSDSRNLVDAILLLLVLASAAAHVRYSWFLKVGRSGGLPRTAWTIALLAPAAATWLVGFFSTDGTLAGVPLWMALCLIGCLLSPRQRWLITAVGLALALVVPTWTVLQAGDDTPLRSGSFLLVAYGALFPVVLLTSLWWWEVVAKLDRHRRVAAELAVAQERLRFAADLHDIQGHHLQVIALKSELAERMLTIDLDAAREHIHETRLIAKQALEETRSLVSGYREIALDNELENAQEVLSAAGATCELDLAHLPDNQVVRRVLALTVREATTNILRHSTATRASISLHTAGDDCTLTIKNNGLAVVAHPNRTPSTGLAGLRERVEAVNGTLETTVSAEEDCFELRVRVPRPIGGAR